MKKEPFLQVSKRRNKAGWLFSPSASVPRSLASPFHCIDPCIDRVRSGDRCPGKDESGGCL